MGDAVDGVRAEGNSREPTSWSSEARIFAVLAQLGSPTRFARWTGKVPRKFNCVTRVSKTAKNCRTEASHSSTKPCCQRDRPRWRGEMPEGDSYYFPVPSSEHSLQCGAPPPPGRELPVNSKELRAQTANAAEVRVSLGQALGFGITGRRALEVAGLVGGHRLGKRAERLILLLLVRPRVARGYRHRAGSSARGAVPHRTMSRLAIMPASARRSPIRLAMAHASSSSDSVRATSSSKRRAAAIRASSVARSAPSPAGSNGERFLLQGKNVLVDRNEERLDLVSGIQKKIV